MGKASQLDPAKLDRLSEAVGFMEKMLDKRTWFADEKFTAADLSSTVTVSQMEQFDFDFTPYPNVQAWLTRCKEFLAPFKYEVTNYILFKFIIFRY